MICTMLMRQYIISLIYAPYYQIIIYVILGIHNLTHKCPLISQIPCLSEFLGKTLIQFTSHSCRSVSGLSLPHLCDYQDRTWISNIMLYFVYVLWFEARGGCLFWWNCWPALFELFFHKIIELFKMKMKYYYNFIGGVNG